MTRKKGKKTTDLRVVAIALSALVLFLTVLMVYLLVSQNKAGTTDPGTTDPVEEEEGLDIVAVYGQSNAMGSKARTSLTTGTAFPKNLLCLNQGPRELPSGLPALVGTFETVKDKFGETSGTAAIATYYANLGKPEKLRVANVVYGEGGQVIANLLPGKALFTGLRNRINKVAESAEEVKAKATRLRAFCFVQGEADRETDQALYQTHLRAILAHIDALAGVVSGGENTAPPFKIMCQISGASSKGSKVQQAYMEMETAGELFIATPMYPLKFHKQDIHLTSLGQRQLGGYFGRAIAHLKEGKKPPALRIKSALIKGSAITLKLSVPTPPLVLVEKFKPINYGFSIKGLLIQEVTFLGEDSIRIVTTTPPAVGALLTYAYSAETSASLVDSDMLESIACGGVRDSCQDGVPDILNGVSDVAGIKLHNWLPHCVVPLVD